MKKVIVKSPGFILHPWIYKKRIVDPGEAEPGDAVLVFNTKNQFLGSYIFNPNSVLALRRYSLKQEPFDYLAIKERLFKAYEYRKYLFRGTGENSFRVVHGESDGLPGLILDKYGNGVVFQINTLAIEKKREELIKAIEDVFNPEFIIERSDSAGRKEEGLEPRKEVIKGSVDGLIEIQVEGIRYLVDVLKGNKTGFFFDQRENRKIAENWAKGRALDLFAYTGGFTLHLLKGGTKEVYSVESNPEHAELIKENVKLNGFDPQKVVVFKKDVFLFLDEMILTGETFDFIVLDPPAFTKKKKAREGALKGYRLLHDRAMRLLAPGGVLITFSCAYYVSGSDLIESLMKSAQTLRLEFKVVQKLTQFKDHPCILGFTENCYLKGWLLVMK